MGRACLLGRTCLLGQLSLSGPNLPTWTSLTTTENLSSWPKNGRGIPSDSLGLESMVFRFKLEARFWPLGPRYAIILHCAQGRKARCKHNVERSCNSVVSLPVKWIKPPIQTLILNCDDAVSRDGSGVQDFCWRNISYFRSMEILDKSY